MSIENYFLEYTNTFHEMRKALKRYLEALDDYCHLTGQSKEEFYTSKTNSKCRGIDDLLINLETLQEEYLRLSENHKILRKKRKQDIDKLENPIHRLILEYAYLDFNENKMILNTLKEYHNEVYSLSHFKRLKAQAIKSFEELIQNNVI